MNLTDCYVTKVLSIPAFEYNHWWVDVEYETWGVTDRLKLMFKTFEEAQSVKIGYKFLG